MAGQLAHALAMAARGFRVFPLRPYGKLPAIDNFHAVATCDPNIIQAWWFDPDSGGEREYNIGVDTTDMNVFDIDTKKGAYALEEYKNAGGHLDTFVVETASAGLHVYFDGPDSKLAVNLVPGVDLRSHHGYVVGPGSYVDAVASGEPTISRTGWYTVLYDRPVKWVPAGLERKLARPNVRREANYSIELDTQTAIANATVWLKDAEPATWGDGGDAHTFKIAAKLLRDYGLSEETGYALLMEHWNPRCLPHPWPPELLWTKVQNAYNYASGDAGSARPEATFGGVQVVPALPPMSAEINGVRAGNALQGVDLERRPWLVHRLLMTGDITTLAAGGAAGKSVLTLAMLAHFAVGKDFGPYKLAVPDVPLRSLVYNAEDDIAEQSRRLTAICHEYRLDYAAVCANMVLMDDSHGEIVLVTGSRQGVAVNEDHMRYVIETAISERVSIIAADPLINLHTCNENDNGQMRFVMTTIRKITRATGTAGIVSHHTSKSTGYDKGDAGGIRGAGAIINSSRIGLMLSGPSETDVKNYGIPPKQKYTYLRIDDAKTNMFARASEPIMWLRWNSTKISTGDFVGVPLPTDMEVMSDKQATLIAEAIQLHMMKEGVATMQLSAVVSHVRTISPLYEKMCEKGVMPLRRLVEKVLLQPVAVGADTLSLVREGQMILVRLA